MDLAASSLANFDRPRSSLQDRALPRPPQKPLSDDPSRIGSAAKRTDEFAQLGVSPAPGAAVSGRESSSASQLLEAMIVRMGGAPQSVYKGMYVDLTM